MEDMITGLCPQCGHTLHIPAELASFSCMYCGARLTKEQLAAEPPAAQEADEDRAAYYDRAVSRLGWCIKNFGGYQKKIMRDVFFEAFETYETGCAPVIQELARGVAPEQQTQLLGRAAAAMLDELEAGWQKKGDMEDEKIVLAIFFVPMVRKQQLPISEEFVTILQKQWVERYPKSPFYLGDYEIHLRRLPQEVPRSVLHHDGRLPGARQAGRLRRADGLPRLPRRVSPFPARRRGTDRGNTTTSPPASSPASTPARTATRATRASARNISRPAIRTCSPGATRAARPAMCGWCGIWNANTSAETEIFEKTGSACAADPVFLCTWHKCLRKKKTKRRKTGKYLTRRKIEFYN